MTRKITLGKFHFSLGKVLLFLGMAAIAFVFIAPFLWVLSASVRNYADATALPPRWLLPAPGHWDLKYIKKLFSPDIPFFTFMGNSIKMSAVITLGMVLHGTLAGYAYARLRFPGKRFMFGLLLVGMMIPVQVTIVPLFKIMNLLGVVNTSLAVTLPSLVGAMSPGLAGVFGIFMMKQFFVTIPKEMEEAARIDGAGVIRTFFTVMLPMVRTMMVSLLIIVFTYAWNDYFTTFIMINSTEKVTLPVGILLIKQPYSTGDNVVFSAVCLSILPVLVVFVACQRWIVDSMVHMGIKG